MKILKNFLHVILVLTTIIYPLFMCQMSAAGWQYNVDAGNYPEEFSVFAFWMRTGSVLLTAACILCLLGRKPKLWVCNAAALLCGTGGIAACMTVLARFTAYADQHFSGMDETMQPVSELYRDRLLPTLLPFALLCVLAVWQLFAYDARVYRQQRRDEKKRLDAQEAPKILGDT
ncbi:MAG: hypothetical protein IJY06_06390 [Oscillospiraceae bacterium]|nr:hypothetical protein [Oscillospiraceae bacterium]MBQ8012660.1 hypothetical protein [Oscillospiraceae bacterium]MBQ9110976.1 hypothetical protein [Oscillospiraceae bacterium]